MKKTWLVLALVLAVATGAYGVAAATAGTASKPKVHGHVGKGHGTVRGTVTSVDTANNQITLTRLHKCDSVTVSLGTTTRVRVNDRKSALANIVPGMVALVKFARDGSTKWIHTWTTHPHNILHGKVAVGGVNTAANKLTITLNKTCASVTLQLTTTSKIQVNDAKSTLASIQNGSRVLVKLNKDDTVRWIKARTPSA